MTGAGEEGRLGASDDPGEGRCAVELVARGHKAGSCHLQGHHLGQHIPTPPRKSL